MFWFSLSVFPQLPQPTTWSTKKWHDRRILRFAWNFGQTNEGTKLFVCSGQLFQSLSHFEEAGCQSTPHCLCKTNVSTAHSLLGNVRCLRVEFITMIILTKSFYHKVIIHKWRHANLQKLTSPLSHQNTVLLHFLIGTYCNKNYQSLTP